MEQHLGRKLLASEEVHHINKNPLDNRLENLVVMGRQDHISLHAKEKQKYPDEKECAACGKKFKVRARKRKRNKCCSHECAQSMRVNACRSSKPSSTT